MFHLGLIVFNDCRWGLIPSYTKPGEKLDPFRMFNARSEVVLWKSFKTVFNLVFANKC